MKLFIPSIGDKFVLSKDWHFGLWREYRNHTAFKFFGIKIGEAGYWADRDKSYPVALPAGTVLTVDRIYIRKGAKDYDSVTFRASVEPKVVSAAPWWGDRFNNSPKGTKKIRSVRFWAKLTDVNTIECEKA